MASLPQELVGLANAQAGVLLDPVTRDSHPDWVGGHRGEMVAVKAAVVAAILSGEADSALQRQGLDRLEVLESLQGRHGLFSSGDNLKSPPDSAFTVNDVATTVELLRAFPGIWPNEGPESLLPRLEAILKLSLPALTVGGVHTPNHRWEIAAALAHGGKLLGGEVGEAAVNRAREWLAEGVDIDEDGIYSERSANYAAYVSDPALLVLADTLDRPDLAGAVHSSLEATLDLCSAKGEVETVLSRRQDQKRLGFPLGPFLRYFARFAVEDERMLRGADLAARSSHVDAVGTAAAALLDERTLAGLDLAYMARRDEIELEGSSERWFESPRLLRWRCGADWVTVYGGSDVPLEGRVGSGLACNPTFLRAEIGDVAVRSLRLSRDFFAMGPFRANHASYEDTRPGHVELRESLRSGYYRPLPPETRDARGAYELQSEGRFSAAMAFDRRKRDDLVLDTEIDVDVSGTDCLRNLEISLSCAGEDVDQSLEIALGNNVELDGALSLGEDIWRFDGRPVVLTADGTRVTLTAAHSSSGIPAGYEPGEAYSFVGGTDAVGGKRLYLTWASSAPQSLHFAREHS